MTRFMSVAVLVCVGTGCTSMSEPDGDPSPPASVAVAPTASTFAGTWRSVTPTLEFVRLTVTSKSSEKDALAARLTLSGVAWEGSGRIEGDQFVANMVITGVSSASSILVARAQETGTLRAQLRPANGATTEITFVRDN